MKQASGEENAYACNEISGTSDEINRVERTHTVFTEHVIRSLPVQEVPAAVGQPVKAHALNVPEMEQAVKDGRVLQVYYRSNFGEGEDIVLVQPSRIKLTFHS